MSIATSIDGGAGDSASKLLELLSNPDAYNAKLTALQAATEQYQSIVALAGPATEILSLRQQIDAEKQAAEVAADQAKEQAAKLVGDAQTQARQITGDAQAEADKLRSAAQKLMSDATAAQAAIQAQQQQLAKAQGAADQAKAMYEARVVDLDAQIKATRAAELDTQQTRADILAKHQAFIASL